MMEDLTGRIFDHLTVIRFSHKNYSHYYWECQCDCGNEKLVIATRRGLVTNITRSCGCSYNRGDKTHGLSGHKLYEVFRSMKRRCYEPSYTYYKNYGGRGIQICKEWLADLDIFYKWAINNGYKEGLTIERINNDGNYEPSNCTWVGYKTQANNRRSNVNVEYNGKIQTLKEWSEEYNINKNTLRQRYIVSKWEFEKALLTPIMKK